MELVCVDINGTNLKATKTIISSFTCNEDKEVLMPDKKIIIVSILLIFIASISGCMDKVSKTETMQDNFIKKLSDQSLNPADFIPKQNLPGNLKLLREINQNGTYVKAINVYYAFYRSEDKKSFSTVAIAKYPNASIAKENYNILVHNFIEGFEQAGEGSKFQKTESVEVKGTPIEKYTTVVLGTEAGVTINLYIWQAGSYAFLVSGGSGAYNEDISLELAKYIIQS